MPDLLIVQRSDLDGTETEGLLVDASTPGVVRLVLDDGVELLADRAELQAALDAEPVAA